MQAITQSASIQKLVLCAVRADVQKIKDATMVKEPPKSGRPLEIAGERQKRRNVTLSDRLAKKALRIGEGSASRGIRIALEYYESTFKSK